MSVRPHDTLMTFYIFSIGLLCAVGGWSCYQVICALMRGRVRRFNPQPIFSSVGVEYCMRADEPGWFRYHVAVYVLQGILAFLLPVYVLCKVLF